MAAKLKLVGKFVFLLVIALSSCSIYIYICNIYTNIYIYIYIYVIIKTLYIMYVSVNKIVKSAKGINLKTN